MSHPRDRAFLVLAVGVQALVFAATSYAARAGEAPSTVVWGLAAAFVPYAAALFHTRRLDPAGGSTVLAPVLTFGLGAIWLAAPPALSDDLYRYLWEGNLWLEGFDPYRLAPDAPALEALRDEGWESINNKPIASIYPPLSQLLFAAAALFGGGVGSVKALALLSLTSVVAALARVTGDRRVALAVGINPLLSSESALNGHFDVLVGGALVAVAWSLSQQRFARAAVATCLAVGLKVVGIVALPFLWRRWRVLLAGAVGCGLLLLPLLISRSPFDPVSGPGQFATRWQGNGSLFVLFDALARLVAPADLAGMVARLAVGLALGISVLVAARRMAPIRGLRLVVWSVLLLSPQVHPWYLAWLLPLDLAAGGRAGLVWSAAVLLAYAPLDGWAADGVWVMPPALQIVEYGVVALALWIDFPWNSKALFEEEGSP